MSWLGSLSELSCLLPPKVDDNTKQEPPQGKNVAMSRDIGLFTASALTVGAIVGSGIFVTPVSVLKYTGSVGAALATWGLTGVMSMIGALCYIELGTTFPRSGSDFTYLLLCLGRLPAFLFLWIKVVVSIPAGTAVSALTFSNYVLEPLVPDCVAPAGVVRIISVLIICLLTFINCRNVSWVTRIQEVFTFAKISALLIIIVMGSYHLFRGHTENLENAFEGTTRQPGYWALGFYSGLYAYGGWNFLNFIVEEVKDYSKNLPRAIFISLPFVTMMYILTNVAYMAVLTPNEILTSNAVAVTFGGRTLGVMSWIMPFSVALSTFGGLNAHLFGSSRLVLVGAREGQLPDFLSMINFQYFTPVPSLVFICIFSIAYLSTTEIYDLINYISWAEAVLSTLTIVGMIWLRLRKPDLERPIKMPLVVPLLYLALCLFLVTFPVYVNPWSTGIGLGITVTGIPVYAATVYWENKPESYRKAIGKTTFFVQKLLLSVPENLEEVKKIQSVPESPEEVKETQSVPENLEEVKKNPKCSRKSRRSKKNPNCSRKNSKK